MAFPTIPTGGRALAVTEADATAVRTFPAMSGLTKNAGDLLIAIVIAYQTTATADAAFSGWSDGFTEFHDKSAATTMCIGMAYKWSTGSETAAPTVTQAATITGHATMMLLSIPGAHATTPPEAGAWNTGTTVAADSPSFDPAGWGAEDTLWIAVGGNGETATGGAFTGITAAPASYTGFLGTGISADVVGGIMGAVAFRQLNAASEDPGAFALDVANARSAMALVAVRPAPTVISGVGTPSLGTFTVSAVIGERVTFPIAASGDDQGMGKNTGSWPFTVVNVDDPAGASIYARQVTWETFLALLRFDTSVIPDTATVFAARLELYVSTLGGDVDDRLFVGEYYTWTPPAVAGDWNDAVGTDAFSADITGVTRGAVNSFALGTLASISKTGYTGFRLGVTGPAPTGDNIVEMASFDDTVNVEPRLIVTYELSSGASGTGSITLVLAASGAATSTISGSLAKALFTASLVASGTAPISGSLAQSLASIAAAGVGAARADGVGTSLLAAVSLASAGTVVTPPVSGVGAPAFPAFVVVSGAATAPASGSLAKSLFVVSFAASGAAPISGALASSLATFAASGAGTAWVSGSGAPSLASAVLVSAGIVTYPPISGAGTPTFPVFAAAGAATAPVSGAGSRPLATVTAVGTSTSTISAVGPPSFGTMSLVATGTAGDPVIDGSGSPALPPIAAVGTSTSAVSGALSKSLLVWSFAGTAAAPIVGQGTRPLFVTGVAGAGIAAAAGSGAAFLPNWLLVSAGVVETRGSGVAAFPNLSAAGATTTFIVASGSPNFALVGSGTGTSGSALLTGSPTLFALSGYGVALALFIRLSPRELARNWGPLVEWSYERRRRILRRRS